MQQAPCTILIVDDDQDFCMLLSSIFDSKKFNVLSAHNLAEARVQLEEGNPTIVLLDNKLPDGEGVEFIDTIFDKDPRIAIFMISGHTHSAIVYKALARGVTKFIAKPCSFKTIVEAVESAMLVN